MYLFQHKNSLFFNTFTLLVELKRFYRFFIQNNRHFPCILGQNVYNRTDEYIKLLMEVNKTNVQQINTEIKRESSYNRFYRVN